MSRWSKRSTPTLLPLWGCNTKFTPIREWKIRGCQLHQCLKSGTTTTTKNCQESTCMYTYLSSPTQLLAASLSQVNQVHPNAERLWGCTRGLTGRPCVQGGFTTCIPHLIAPSLATAPDPFPPCH